MTSGTSSTMDEPPKLIETIPPNKADLSVDATDASILSMDATMYDEVSPVHHVSVWDHVWNYAVATAALTDFAAAWTHQIEKDRWEQAAKGETPAPLPTWLAVLAVNHVSFGLLFCLFWFVDSIVSARKNWVHTVRDLDRQRLLKKTQDDGANKEENNTTTSKENKANKVETTTWFGLQKPTAAYIKTIMLQIGLLPVGFYYFLYQVSIALLSGDGLSGHVEWLHHDELHDTMQKHQHRHHSAHHDAHQEDEVDNFDSYVNYSLIFAVLHLGTTHLGRMLKKEGERQGKKVAVKVAKQALRHPISFSRRLKKILAYLRWVKYLIPIIATSNKLLQNSLDLLKKMRQKREAYLARKMRRALMLERTPSEIREQAALQMQKVYRAKKARQKAKAIKLIQGNRETWAAMKMQKKFRLLLERARERIRKNKEELAALKKKQEEMKATRQNLDDQDRARMYKLQLELEKQTDYVINKMLLRPNTRFIVWWKFFFCFAVIFEIAGNALEPKMQKRYKSYNQMVEQNIVPTRWASLPVCNPKPPSLKAHEKVMATIGNWTGSDSLKPEPFRPPPTPWYCSSPVAGAQGAVVSSMQFTIRHFDLFMAVVFFLDVFISFFTGDLDEETGVLKPPGFFPRYILPGVLLQCIVNPQMETTAKIIKWIITEFILLGPVRVTRWTIALVVPLVLLIHKSFQLIRRKVAEKRSTGVL